jgi:hypothetical protein
MELGSEAARRRLPELLERSRRGEQTVIQRHGVAVAALVPLSQRLQPGRQSLLALRGSGRGCWQQEASAVVDALRREWG